MRVQGFDIGADADAEDSESVVDKRAVGIMQLCGFWEGQNADSVTTSRRLWETAFQKVIRRFERSKVHCL